MRFVFNVLRFIVNKIVHLAACLPLARDIARVNQLAQQRINLVLAAFLRRAFRHFGQQARMHRPVIRLGKQIGK